MEILLSKVPGERLKYGKKVLKVTPSEDGAAKYDVHFSDGTTETSFHLVVGGDGAWSRVRSLLTDVKPSYSGISSLEICLNDPSTAPEISDFVGAGSMFAFGEGRAADDEDVTVLEQQGHGRDSSSGPAARRGTFRDRDAMRVEARRPRQQHLAWMPEPRVRSTSPLALDRRAVQAS